MGPLRSLPLFVLSAAAWAVGCAPAAPGADGGATDDAGLVDGGGAGGDAYLPRLESDCDLDALSVEGGEVKYLFALEGATPPWPIDDACAFQDMDTYAFHLQFLRSFDALSELTFDEYVALVLERPTRVWWGGGARFWPDVQHPTTGSRGVLSFTIYADQAPESVLTVDDVVAVHEIVRACAPAFAERAAFLPSDAAQQDTALAARADLADRGVAIVLDAELEGRTSQTTCTSESP